MNHRRLVGIDLGIASAHTVRVLDGEGEVVAKRKAWPTVESLGEVEAAALAGCPVGTRLEVVVEPTENRDRPDRRTAGLLPVEIVEQITRLDFRGPVISSV